MKPLPEIHYLIKATYLARVFAYAFAVLILASRALYVEVSPAYGGLLAFLVVYPHLNFAFFSRFGNTAQGARLAMVADSALIGVMIALVNVQPLAVVSLVSALVMSTLMFAPMKVLLLTLICLSVSAIVSCVLLMPGLEIQNWWLTDALSAAFIVTYGGLVAYLGFRESSLLETRRRATDRERNVIEAVNQRLRAYVPAQLASSIEQIGEVTTARKMVTVFFSDIEGFTTLMDSVSEETVTTMLNEYLNEMAEIALAHGGTIDKFIGDGVMIFFGAPRSEGVGQDAHSCVQMALSMRQRLKNLSERWRQDGINRRLHIRIGIHSGYCAVGNFGSRQRMDYTVVGGVVNLASRLESAAGRDEILVSEKTWSLVNGTRFHGNLCGQRKTPIRVKGIGTPVAVVAVSSRKLIPGAQHESRSIVIRDGAHGR